MNPEGFVYRIYTERFDSRGELLELVQRYFPVATLVETAGLWNGTFELSCIIEIIGSADDYQKVVFLAGDIKTLNKQESVLVTRQTVGVMAV